MTSKISMVERCEDYLIRSGDVFENYDISCRLGLDGLRVDCQTRIKGMTYVRERQFLCLPPAQLIHCLREDRLVVFKAGLPLNDTSARPRKRRIAIPALLNLQLEHLPRDELEKCAVCPRRGTTDYLCLCDMEQQTAVTRNLEERLCAESRVKPECPAWTTTQVKMSPPFGPGVDEEIENSSENDTQMLSGVQVTYGKGQHSQCISAGDVTSVLVSQYQSQHEDDFIPNVFIFEGEWIPSLEFTYARVRQLSRMEGDRQAGRVIGSSDSTFRHLHGFHRKVVTFKDGTTAICKLKFIFEEYPTQLPDGESTNRPS